MGSVDADVNAELVGLENLNDSSRSAAQSSILMSPAELAQSKSIAGDKRVLTIFESRRKI